MAKQKKSVYIFGSMLIGIVAVLAVLLILAGTGVIDTKSRDLVFTASTAEAVYDGSDLTSAEWELTAGELKKGHTAKVTVSGTQVGVGSCANEISVVIEDEQGADVSEKYNIRCIAGTLTVVPRYYEIKSGSAQKVYDGLPLVDKTYTVVSGDLPEGHDISVAYTGELTNVGSEPNTFSAIIRDSKNRDVTSNFTLVCTPGRLDVTKRAITFKSPTKQDVYNGTELKAGNAEITDNSALAIGQRVEYEFTGSITEVGSVPNAFTAKIFAGNIEVTDNYSVTYDIGTLTVTPRLITVASAGDSRPYDGTVLTAGSVYLMEGKLPDDEFMEYSTTGKRTDVGTSPNTFDLEIKNTNGKNTTRNYSITKNRGELTVTPKEITIITGGKSKPYDGEVLEYKSYEVKGNVADCDHMFVDVTGSQTEVGSSQNMFVVTIYDGNGKDKSGNYTITPQCGMLTVTPIGLTIKTGTEGFVYDGTQKMCDSWCIVDSYGNEGDWHTSSQAVSVAGGKLNVSVHGAGKDAGTYSNGFTVTVTDDSGYKNLTDCFIIEKLEGTITVSPRPITVRTDSKEFEYNGDKRTWDWWRIEDSGMIGAWRTSGPAFIIGGIISVSVLGERTDVGESANLFTVTVSSDEEDKEISRNYSITMIEGVITVTPQSITIRSNDFNGEYNGDFQSCKEWGIVESDGTVSQWYNSGETYSIDGGRLSVAVSGTRKHVGMTTNTFTVTIASDASDVSSNYSITKEPGIINITPCELTVRSADQTFVYDGTTKSYEYWGIVLPNGTCNYTDNFVEMLSTQDILYVTVSGYATAVGTASNNISAYVEDSEGNIVTSNYNIVKETGVITVTPRPVTVISADYTWEFDNEEHSTNTALTGDMFDDDFTAVYISTATPLAAGHSLFEAYTVTTCVNVGAVMNQISDVIIVDEGGANVTANYAVTKQLGILNIIGKGGVRLGGGNNDDSIALWLLSDRTETVYLREQSYGDYDYQGFYSADEYKTDGKAGMNYLASYALGGYTANELGIRLMVGTNFLVPYYSTAQGEYIQTSDVYSTGDPLNYTMYCYSYEYASDNGAAVKGKLPAAYKDAESAYYSFVSDYYLTVPDDTRAELNKIISAKGFNKSDANIIGAVASFVRGVAPYNIDYDRSLDEQPDIAVAFLSGKYEGICQHYAAAATMLYRAINIPARYVVGYMGVTKAGVWSKVTAKQAHAWVEVYIQGTGWVYVEVTGGSADAPGDDVGQGELKSGETFTVKPVDWYKKYDGTPLEAPTRVQGMSKLLENGYTYKAVIEGSQTDVGYGESTIKSLIIFNSAGSAVYSYTDGGTPSAAAGFDYKVVIQNGTLHVYNYLIVLKTGSAIKQYDGGALVNNTYKMLNGTRLEKGHTFANIRYGSISTVGITANTFSAQILDDGNDVTYQYRIEVDAGTLEITPIHITIHTFGKTAYSSELDGEDLTCYEYEILDEGNNTLALCKGNESQQIRINGYLYTIECVMNSSQSWRGGSTENTVNSVTIRRGMQDVTASFFIEYVFEYLQVIR